MLAKSKLKSIDTLISQALIDMDISHEEFITILKEKDRYEMMKENLRNKNGNSYEIMRFNSVKSKLKFIKCITYKMKTYCLKCRKDTENIDLKISSTSNGKSMILSKSAICGSKNSRFI